jgi:hypothetical protein
MKYFIFLSVLFSMTVISARAESVCKEASDNAIAHSKYYGSDYQNCRGDTCIYTYQEGDGGDSCSYSINVPVTRNGNKCEAGKPELDSSTANCG